jgi:hypothetical protein
MPQYCHTNLIKADVGSCFVHEETGSASLTDASDPLNGAMFHFVSPGPPNLFLMINMSTSVLHQGSRRFVVKCGATSRLVPKVG